MIPRYLPECHTFVGRVFVQLHWSEMLRKRDEIQKYLPPLFKLIVKLSTENEMRKVNEFQRFPEVSCIHENENYH